MRRALLAALLAASAPATAGIPVTEQRTCPIGGERFSFTTTASYSTWGGRPDGKPYGSWEFPLDLPECPGNGLILYKEFDEAELARLRPILDRADFRALRRAGDVQYYRLHWLMREMGSPPLDHLWMLVQAGWQAEIGSPLRARYLEELAQAMAGLGGEPGDIPGFAMRGRWINALRELGRFDEAAALHARTSLEPLRALGEGDGRGWLSYYEMLGTLIGRRDGDAEPFDFISRREAVFRCLDQADSLTESQRGHCAGEGIRAEVERLRRARGTVEPPAGE